MASPQFMNSVRFLSLIITGWFGLWTAISLAEGVRLQVALFFLATVISIILAIHVHSKDEYS